MIHRGLTRASQLTSEGDMGSTRQAPEPMSGQTSVLRQVLTADQQTSGSALRFAVRFPPGGLEHAYRAEMHGTGIARVIVLAALLGGCSTTNSSAEDACREAAQSFQLYGALRSAQATAGSLLHDNVRFGSDIQQELARYEAEVAGLDTRAGEAQERALEAANNCGDVGPQGPGGWY